MTGLDIYFILSAYHTGGVMQRQAVHDQKSQSELLQLDFSISVQSMECLLHLEIFFCTGPYLFYPNFSWWVELANRTCTMQLSIVSIAFAIVLCVHCRAQVDIP